MAVALEQPFDQFCRECGIATPVERERIRSGRNSEVWLLTSGADRWVLKHYFQRAPDRRDRLGAEFAFLTFAAEHGLELTARPIGREPRRHWGLYSFLPGSRPTLVTPAYVEQAADFIAEINRVSRTAAAITLGTAADACFSWLAHLQLAETRLARLASVSPESDVEREAVSFVARELAPAWRQIRASVADAVSPGDLTASLPAQGRILSPSDFGFHNTLEHDGTLGFLDFEYAGWDDPAKLICDFRCQPELPVPDELGVQFMERLLDELPESGRLRERVDPLMPVHRMKWCGILLNELEPAGRERRAHAGRDIDGLLESQLSKARVYFSDYVASIL